MTDKSIKGATAQHLRCAAAGGCAESRLLLSRRAMLGVTASLFSWAYLPRVADAATSDPRLLVVMLRGGMDGINVVIPNGDPAYPSMRGSIAIPAASTIQLDGFFGLHPAMSHFGAMFQGGDAAVVHAAGLPLRNRSHFDCQDNLEAGLSGYASVAATGWLNRVLSALPANSPVKLGGGIEISDAPLILRGPAPVLGWSPTWFSAVEDPTLQQVRTLYQKRDQDMYDMLERGLKANALALGNGGDDDGVSQLRKGFRGAGRLIAAADGPRIAVLSVDGWDTHADQGGASGYLSEVMIELDLAIQDFKDACGPAWPSTAMVAVTEFGRTVHVNGDDGTDHGVGTVALLAGGAINGGHVFGDWPGIAQNQLYEDSDLVPTTDVRSIFKGLLQDHLGMPKSILNKTIFPDSAAAPIFKNLIRSGTPSVAASGEGVNLRSEAPIARYRRTYQLAQAMTP